MLLLRRRLVGPLWILFWAHASLQSARHIPLFAAVALPFLGAEIQRWWDGWAGRLGRRSAAAQLDALARDMAPEFERATLWPAAALALAMAGILPFGRIDDFPENRFPVEIARRHEGLLRGARIFTQDQWADYLIYRFHPAVKVFFDGRSDFYGREIALDYLNTMNGNHRWRAVLDRHRFDTVLLPPGVALASLLKESSEWAVVDDDGTAVLFRRRQPAGWKAELRAVRRPWGENSVGQAPNEIP
jgi:hypothetical protein